MRFSGVFAAALFGVASLALRAQQAEARSLAAVAEPAIAHSAASFGAEAAAMSPVAGELMNTLDSRSAKPGDRVVIKTKATVRIAEGVEIPKGSKLIGHVIAAKASSAADANAQVALQFDQVELRNGKTLSIHAEMQSLSAAGDASNAVSDAAAPSPSPASGGRSAGDMYGSSPSPMANTRIGNGGAAPATAGIVPPAGTLVARTGTLAIRTTSVPGVLLAVNEPGPGDARSAQSSGILLGAKRDVHLDEGATMVLGVVVAAASAAGN